MTKPIDILTEAVRVADAGHCLDPRQYADIVVDALADDQIVANAVRALVEDGWREGHEGPNGQSEQSDEDLANIARIVLRSVRGES